MRKQCLICGSPKTYYFTKFHGLMNKDSLDPQWGSKFNNVCLIVIAGWPCDLLLNKSFSFLPKPHHFHYKSTKSYTFISVEEMKLFASKWNVMMKWTQGEWISSAWSHFQHLHFIESLPYHYMQLKSSKFSSKNIHVHFSLMKEKYTCFLFTSYYNVMLKYLLFWAFIA